MILNRVRLRLVDKNGSEIGYAMPCGPGVDESAAVEFKDLYRPCSSLEPRELALVNVVNRFTGSSFGGPTPLSTDIAVLTFTSTGPYGLRVPIFGPNDIFLDDDVTIDRDNLNIIALTDFILERGRDRVGNELRVFKGGKREGGA